MGILIRDLPPDERPRERMFRVGAGSLSVVELLAVLLGSGAGRGCSAIALAQALLAKYSTEGIPTCGSARVVQGGTTVGVAEGATVVRHNAGMTALTALACASLIDIQSTPGLGTAKAARIVAALELGRRLGGARLERDRVSSPGDVADLLGARLRLLDREHFVVVLLDTKNHLLGSELIAVGSLDAAIVHPREVFKAAIRKSASSMILVHNHPSGDPEPSEADLVCTRRLEEAGRVLGIPVLDHVIIGDGRYTSLRQGGIGGLPAGVE